MTEMMVKGRAGHYTDDSGICSYSSSAVGSVSSSSANYLSSLKNILDSSEIALPPVGVHLVIPELEIETTLQLNQNDSIWNIKQCILCTIATNLEDGLNHGIYCPPVNGRAGKYLDEERYLGEYNLQEDTVLHLVRKRRVYKSASFDWKKIQEYNTKTRCRRLIHHLKSGNLVKVNGLLERGLDPNFHDESGETPLTMAVSARYPRDPIMTLVEGGALLDYRNRFCATALHKAAQFGNKEAVQTLLELGASPNYKDARGLTPLYYTVCNATDPACTELLLRDYAILGARDESGWTELHQACRYGRVQHLEHLIFYGSDVNSRNFSGNTPLHVCALNNQEECARVLLFRGADKTVRNFINQDAESLANLNGYPRLAEIIQQFSPRDVVVYQETPQYNTRRRRLTKSFRGGSGEERSEESWNPLQLQQHLSRSTSHLPDCSSDVFLGSSYSRKSQRDSLYQSISRSSSISRKSSNRTSRSSSRPSSQCAFEDPEDLKQQQKPSKAAPLKSCDAAGQRSRARSRSRASGLASVFDRFKSAQNDDSDGGKLTGTSTGCSNPPPPPPPSTQPIRVTTAVVTAAALPLPGRDSAANAYSYQPPQPPMLVHDPSVAASGIACLRDLIRPKPESGSGQTSVWKTTDHQVQGPNGVALRWSSEGENQRQASAFRLERSWENDPTAHRLSQPEMTNKTGHLIGSQFSQVQISSPGHQLQENQTGRQLETTQGKHPGNRLGNLQGRHLPENHSSHQLGIQSSKQQGHVPVHLQNNLPNAEAQRSVSQTHVTHSSTGDVYIWTRDSNREGSQHIGTLQSRLAGQQRERPQTGGAVWRPTPPPPPPRSSAPVLTMIQSETENAETFETASRGRHPPNIPTEQKPHQRDGQRCHTNPYSSAPSFYHPASEPKFYGGSMAQFPRCNALPVPIGFRSDVEPSQRNLKHVSPPASPLPPFPDVIGASDYQPLPPPPPPDLIESYIPPPPMFHSSPPPAPPNLPSFLHAPGKPDSRGNMATDRILRSEEGSRSDAAMQSALFAAILRRRQAIEGGSRYSICTES